MTSPLTPPPTPQSPPDTHTCTRINSESEAIFKFLANMFENNSAPAMCCYISSIESTDISSVMEKGIYERETVSTSKLVPIYSPTNSGQETFFSVCRGATTGIGIS